VSTQSHSNPPRDTHSHLEAGSETWVTKVMRGVPDKGVFGEGWLYAIRFKLRSEICTLR